MTMQQSKQVMPELAKATADFCQKLINKGWGLTSDRALPGEFDTVCHLLQQCGYEIQIPMGNAAKMTATEAAKSVE